MQAALWDQAMQGDLAAAQAILRIVTARCQLLGLYDQRLMEPFTPRTVVVTSQDRAALGL